MNCDCRDRSVHFNSHVCLSCRPVSFTDFCFYDYITHIIPMLPKSKFNYFTPDLYWWCSDQDRYIHSVISDPEWKAFRYATRQCFWPWASLSLFWFNTTDYLYNNISFQIELKLYRGRFCVLLSEEWTWYRILMISWFAPAPQTHLCTLHLPACGMNEVQ